MLGVIAARLYAALPFHLSPVLAFRRALSLSLSLFLSLSLVFALFFLSSSLVHHRRNGGARGTRRREIGRMGILLLESTPYWTSIGILEELSTLRKIVVRQPRLQVKRSCTCTDLLAANSRRIPALARWAIFIGRGLLLTARSSV